MSTRSSAAAVESESSSHLAEMHRFTADMTYKAVWSQSGFPVSLVLIKAAVPASLVAQSFSVPLEGGVFIPGDSTLNLLLQSWGAFIGVEFLVEKHILLQLAGVSPDICNQILTECFMEHTHSHKKSYLKKKYFYYYQD